MVDLEGWPPTELVGVFKASEERVLWSLGTCKVSERLFRRSVNDRELPSLRNEVGEVISLFESRELRCGRSHVGALAASTACNGSSMAVIGDSS